MSLGMYAVTKIVFDSTWLCGKLIINIDLATS